ncbi:8-desaturase) [Durusdinium trenchii]|uniref:8-desaturase n=1 Tax=Durusdinium trenchii TaxID=1381693 RepID=A0ABP0IWK5_9DINO
MANADSGGGGGLDDVPRVIASPALVQSMLDSAQVAKPVVARALGLLGRLREALGIDRFLRMVALLQRHFSLSSKKVVAAGALAAGAAYFASQGNKNRRKHKARRVAVVGSGIAGMGAAWALNRAGVDVVLYEKKPKVGGNAKNMTWDVDGEKVETGLAVLAWPDKMFHNYNCLIEDLGVEKLQHDMKFFVGERDAAGKVTCAFAHGRPGWEPDAAIKEDLRKWDQLYQFVKRVNAFFSPCSVPSMYRVSMLNPLNLIPLRTLCRLYGISDRFWEFVFVPIHTSTFLEIEMDTVPALMAELLNEIVPFTETPNMRTWKTHSYDTLRKMSLELPKDNVRTSCGVESVRYIPRANPEDGFDVKVLDEDDEEHTYDAVIFACSAQAMNRILHGKGQPLPGQPLLPNQANGLNNNTVMSSWKRWFLNGLETTLLSHTLYTTDRDKTFERGTAHTNATAVFPDEFKAEILDEYCNYIEVDARNPRNLENSFVISSWAPTMQAPHLRGKLPMMVTYNADKKLENVETEWVSTSREAHPCLTMKQLASSTTCWPMLQGARNGQTYFCGSAVLPANGHDMSFLSGLVAANELGAPYPFSHDPVATGDFERMRKLMLWFWA